MRHFTLIPDGHPQSYLFDNLLSQAIDIINADEVYLSIDNTSPENVFTFLIDTTYTRIDNELLQPLNRIFQNYPSITYKVFACDYAADALTKSNLYFLRHCTLGNLVYSNPEATHSVDPKSEIAGLGLPRTKKLYKKALVKIEGRYVNFPKCLKYEKYLEAAYILHQMLEQLFRLAELFLTGKQLLSKDISEHQAELTAFAPSLGIVFNPADEEECRLQKLLYKSYVAFRQKDRFEIGRDDLEKLLYKTQWTKQEVERLFKESVQHCYGKLKSEGHTISNEMANNIAVVDKSSPEIASIETTVENKKPNEFQETVADASVLVSDEHIKTIIDIICRAVKTAAVYCFAKHRSNNSYHNAIDTTLENGIETAHYYLLVFCYKSGKCPSNDLADTIRAVSKGRYTATVLVHKTHNLKQTESDQYWFFNTVLTKGQLLYSDGKFQTAIEPIERNTTSLSKAEWYCKDRMRIADAFSDSLQEVSFERSHDVMPILLHQIVEQACLGMIRLILGYSPDHFSLSHLFEICSLFTNLPADFFPRASKVEKEIFQLLNTPVWELRYASQDNVEKMNVKLLENRCEEFLAHVDLFVRKANGEKDAELKYYNF